MVEIDVKGVRLLKGYLDRVAQEALVEDVREIVRKAPFRRPMTPWGKPMRVKMTSAGRYGWHTDRSGYRYIDAQLDGRAWPQIPGSVLALWDALIEGERRPDCLLVNYYDAKAKMGMHQDKDERDFGWSVLSVSLGDTARFRVGGTERGGETQSVELESGDVAILGGAARMAYHGIDRIKPGSSTLLKDGGRINLTCRVVD
jgi:alkylated DNA repair protein (DNA oxidative demethylase)